jgi:SAM-dependent methyltransferase
MSAAPEWPVIRDMILNNTNDNLNNKKILDLGCGYGWFTRWARDNGATSIRAVDISQKMIDRAEEFELEAALSKQGQRDSVSDAKVTFEISDLAHIILNNESEREGYDLVYSSLAFHYIEDLGRLFREIHASLRKTTADSQKGKLVFSVEHPIGTAPICPGPDWRFVQDGLEEHKFWPLNSYGNEGLRLTSWLGTEGVRKYHRTVETYVTLLLENGFVLIGLKDWSPSKEDVAGEPAWSIERHRPYFLLISAEVK